MVPESSGDGLPEKDNHKEDNAEQTTSRKRKPKEVAVFGNYRNYYGYRVDENLNEDPRLKVMKQEWFEGKDCLDIGCNSGLITISIAKKFCCRSVLGIDIDRDRIEDACWTLRKIMRMSKTKPAKAESVNKSENHIIESATQRMQYKPGDSASMQAKDLSDIVSFEKGNFVKSWQPPENKRYHAVTCLSVTKWVHLNWGDEGLITLFWKAWRLLHPGGVFIVEPQPWSSYYNNRLVSETINSNYKQIEIRPDDFQEILLDKIGFRTVENLTPSLSGSKTGFNRPILAFWK